MNSRLNSGITVILRTLVYYDIFDYPLSEKDILTNCGLLQAENEPCRDALDYLVEKGIIFKLGDYYSLQNNYLAVERRIKGNKLAKKWMKKAKRFSKFISWFPYVRGISLSGSLSKGFIGEDPDIDYFIITKPNRLWLARTLLIAFKKVFLFNSYKYFCLNYFINTENLEIEEKNLFTATEIATMIPILGGDIKQRFYKHNQWIRDYFPNYQIDNVDSVPNGSNNWIKQFIEFIFNGKIGARLDDHFMKVTIRHWSKKFKNNFTEEEFALLFKSKKNISKHHPQNFQKVVLNAYENKLKELEQKFDIVFDNDVRSTA